MDMPGRLSNVNPGTALTRPSSTPDRPGILHLGLGNFHRAHQAVFTAAAMEAEPGAWGIVGAANTSHRVVDPLREQDGRYTVLTLDPQGATAEVIALHTDFLVAGEQPDALLGTMADERIRIVTLTVTENGYSYSPRTGELETDSDSVVSDLAGEGPTTTIGRLARGLERRFRSNGAPLAIVSCDNLQDNGRLTQALVRRFIEVADGPDSADVLHWLDDQVTFPSTMVDRIVPATEDTHREQVRELTGVSDHVAVPAEPFNFWVMEDRFAGGRPAWEAGGAIFAEDVKSYELLKLRVLNASNSMLAYLGLLGSRAYIAESLALRGVGEVLEKLMREEMVPTLDVPEAIDIDDYIRELFERFGNRAVGHRTAQVGSDGSAKLPVRITEAVHHHMDRDGPPAAIALLVAAYIRCLANPSDAYPVEVTGAPTDPRAEDLAALGRRHTNARDLVHAVFDEAQIFTVVLSEETGFVDRVTELYSALQRDGLDAAIRDALA